MLSDRQLRDSVMIDAELMSFEQSYRFGLWQQVIVLTGTCEGQAKIHLLDRDELHGGDATDSNWKTAHKGLVEFKIGAQVEENKDARIVVTCKSGGRSALATRSLQSRSRFGNLHLRYLHLRYLHLWCLGIHLTEGPFCPGLSCPQSGLFLYFPLHNDSQP